jgi:glyoxylase-like metal-dependent hydrolase (beta-lactamase superfamily II)
MILTFLLSSFLSNFPLKFFGIKMKIGKYKLHIIHSGYFALDGGAMFGIIPKNLWNSTNPADSQNRIQLSTRNLLLVSDSRKILIDTGMGNKWNEKEKEIYNIQQEEFSLHSSMKKAGFHPREITDVILTHLHFDHTGGSTHPDNGKIVPAFPNAVFHTSKKNYEWAINPSDRDRGSYIKDNFLPLHDEGVLKLNESNSVFDDEISFVEVNGHTFGQQLIKISDSTNTLLYCGDLFPTSSHIKLPYIMGYDLQPLVTLQEKKNILPKVVEENWILFFEHDPFIAAASINKGEKGFSVKEKYDTL